MARRKLTVVEQAIKDASAELGLPKDHWDVERLATLQVMLKAARHKWENGQSSSAASDMVTLMEEITKLRAAAGLASGPREMEITFVEGVTGVYKCTECGHENRLAPRVTATQDALIEPQTASTDTPAPAESPPAVVPLTSRPGTTRSPRRRPQEGPAAP